MLSNKTHVISGCGKFYDFSVLSDVATLCEEGKSFRAKRHKSLKRIILTQQHDKALKCFPAILPLSVIWGWICCLTVTVSFLNVECYLSFLPFKSLPRNNKHEQQQQQQQRYSISKNILTLSCLITYEIIIRMAKQFRACILSIVSRKILVWMRKGLKYKYNLEPEGIAFHI